MFLYISKPKKIKLCLLIQKRDIWLNVALFETEVPPMNDLSHTDNEGYYCLWVF